MSLNADGSKQGFGPISAIANPRCSPDRRRPHGISRQAAGDHLSVKTPSMPFPNRRSDMARHVATLAKIALSEEALDQVEGDWLEESEASP